MRQGLPPVSLGAKAGRTLLRAKMRLETLRWAPDRGLGVTPCQLERAADPVIRYQPRGAGPG